MFGKLGKIAVVILMGALGLLLSPSVRGDEWTPDDIRVESFVKARWGQRTHNDTTNGISCYNRYMPNKTWCGCVATSVGMVLRALRYPDTYDWSKMPYSTLTGVEEEQAEAIGRLLANLAIWSEAQCESDATYIYLYKTAATLRRSTESKGFGYAEADYVDFRDEKGFAYDEDKLKRIVIPCCDYGTPVVLSIDPQKLVKQGDRHAVTIDGYGYSNGVFCVHARCGGYGVDDGWFKPPKFTIVGNSYVKIVEALFNILPREAGTIVSGRVIAPNGVPAVGAEVKLVDAQGVVQTTQTKKHGVYAFLVKNMGEAVVSSAFGAGTAVRTVTVEQNVGAAEAGESWKIGNTYGNDLDLEEPDHGDPVSDAPTDPERVVEKPTIAPPTEVVNGEIDVTLATATAGAVIRYTTDNTEPSEASAVYTGPVRVNVSAEGGVKVFRARAWKNGLEMSNEAVSVYVPSIETAEEPLAVVTDVQGQPIAETKGVYTFSDRAYVTLDSPTPDTTIRYTLDGSAPTPLSPVYTEPLRVTENTVVTAGAWRDKWYASSLTCVSLVYDPKATKLSGDDFASPVKIEGSEGTKVLKRVSQYNLETREAQGNNKPQFVDDYRFNGWYWDNEEYKKKGEQATVYTNAINHIYANVGDYIKGWNLQELFHTAWFEWTAPETGRVTFTLACLSEQENFNWDAAAAVYEDNGADEPVLENRVTYSFKRDAAYNIFAVDVDEGKTYRIVAAIPWWNLTSVRSPSEKEQGVTVTDPTAKYELAWSMGEDEDTPPVVEEKMDISASMVLLSDYVSAYSGKAWAPKISRLVCNGTTLEPYVDYVYTFEGEQGVGSGTVTLTGCGNYEGILTEKFSVVRRRIVDDMVSQIPEMQVTGKAIEPEVAVTLEDLVFEAGKDYEVTYSNNVELGTAFAIVTGKGGCYGTAVRTFEIIDCPIGDVGEPFGPKSVSLMGVDPDVLDEATKVEAAGLPAGLKLVKDGADYVIQGTPTEVLDNNTRRAYLLVTLKTKEQRLLPLKLVVNSDMPVVETVIDQSSLRFDKSNEQAVVSTGVTVYCPVTIDTDETVKVTASGLPTGLSFVDKGGVRAIQGVATKAGVYLATLTAKSGKDVVSVGTAAFRVVALPEWAQGTFAGSRGTGSLSVTVAAAGKLSGKAVCSGASLSVASSAYASETDLPSYVISGTLSGSGTAAPFAAAVTNWVGEFGGVTFTNATLVGEGTLAYRNPWKDKRLTVALETVAGAYTYKTADDETLTLTVDPKGTVKVAGTLAPKRKVSVSTAVDLTESGTLEAFVYVPADKTNSERSWRLTLVPYHDDPEDYGSNAYRDAAVSYEVGGVKGSEGSGTVTLSPKYGQAAVGKAVTLTAKADKSSTFVKWVRVDAEGNETAAGYAEKLTATATGEDVRYKAVFRNKTVARLPRIVFDESAFAALRVGVAFDQTVEVRNPDNDGDDQVRPVKFTAGNLPAGLKLDATSGRVYGVPTKAVVGKPFTVTATSTVNKNMHTTEELAESVAAQPDWSVGTFAGACGTGSISLTVAAGGKTSAKVVEDGTSWTCSASGFASEGEGPTFGVAGNLTAGKVTVPFKAAVTNWVGEFGGVTFTNATLVGEETLAYRNPWKDKRLTAALETVAGAYTYKTADDETLTLTVDPKGTVKVAGTLAPKRKVSVSTTVDLTESGTLEAFVYVPADKTNPEKSWRLTLVPYHDDPEDYGSNAYRDAAVSYEIGGVEGSEGSGTVTLSPKYGQAAVGKTVTLTAKADKNSTFVKWVRVDAEGDETAAGYAEKLTVVATGEDAVYRAVFRDKKTVQSPRIVFNREAFAALRVGVAFDQTVEVRNPDDDGDDLVRPVKFTAANLPAGLKLDATSGRVYGVPTKAVEGKAFTITATSTVDKGKTAGPVTLAESVAALPVWAQGSFTGRLGERGMLTLTVGSTGKTSAKAYQGGTNWTFEASSYAMEKEDGSLAFVGTLNAKKEKVSIPFVAVVTNWPASFGGVEYTGATLVGDQPETLAYRVPWSDKSLASALAKSGLIGSHETQIGGADVTLTVDAKGTVKVAGTLGDGRKLSQSGSLILDETGGASAYIYVAPAAGKPEIGGFAPISQK